MTDLIPGTARATAEAAVPLKTEEMDEYARVCVCVAYECTYGRVGSWKCS